MTVEPEGATLQAPGVDAASATSQLPFVRASDGASGFDVSRVLGTTGRVLYDPGFATTAACRSEITYVDGENGILRYRGYPIEQLAQQSTFLETAYLLIYGELPTRSELETFEDRIRRHTLIDEDLREFFGGFPRDAHPMAVLSASVSALSTFYQDSLDPFDPEQVEISTIRLMAKVPTLAAYAYKKSIGQPFLYPDNSLSFTANFLQMTFGVPAERYAVDVDLIDALDLLLVLHADHEQNCSTSTVRLVGSSHANLFASVSAGINALFGPLHGGANQAVMDMLSSIHLQGLSVDEFVARVKNRSDSARLMGFGHRIYRHYDPRATIVKKVAHSLLAEHAHSRLLDIAVELEDRALTDEYFVERRLYPNVDFYTGLIYSAMGFPPNMFTVLFALGRLPGWIAQWREMIADPDTRLGRPRQIYVGSTVRDYKPIDTR